MYIYFTVRCLVVDRRWLDYIIPHLKQNQIGIVACTLYNSQTNRPFGRQSGGFGIWKSCGVTFIDATNSKACYFEKKTFLGFFLPPLGEVPVIDFYFLVNVIVSY